MDPSKRGEIRNFGSGLRLRDGGGRTSVGRGVRVARGKTNESAAKIVIGFRKIIRILRHPVVERCRSTIFRIRRRGGKGGEPLA